MLTANALGYLRLIRPINCLMMGFAVVVGSALAGPSILSSRVEYLILGFVTGFTLTAASMAINDYRDRDIDAVNEPKRPIPSGSIAPKKALTVASVLTLAGFVTAFFVNLYCLFVAAFSWGILATYTTVGKRTGFFGNLLVSICIAIPFAYGSLAAVGTVTLNVLFFAAIAFLSNMGREITKGIVDIKGDSAQNVRTLAVRRGSRYAARAAAAFYVAAVVLSPIPYLTNAVSDLFIPFVLVTDVGLLGSSVVLMRDYSREKARTVKNIVLLWFITGLLAFIIGSVTAI